MRSTSFLLLSCLCLAAGIITYAFYNELLIVQIATNKNSLVPPVSTVEKKKFLLHYWHNAAWHTEDKELIQATDLRKTIGYLITAWLNLLEEEQLIHKKTTVQSVMLDQTERELYISFDHSFLPKHYSTYEKLLLVEGLLKTIRASTPQISHIIFLVHHQPLQDAHLDFTQPWPITGFLST